MLLVYHCMEENMSDYDEIKLKPVAVLYMPVLFVIMYSDIIVNNIIALLNRLHEYLDIKMGEYIDIIKDD